MGTCGNKKATLTRSVLESENKDKNETLKLQKGNELKESKTLKEEVVEPNIDLRSSQAPNYDSKEEKDLKDASNLINSD